MAAASLLPTRVRRFALVARRLPLAASIGLRHLGRHRLVAASRLVRALPGPVRVHLAATLGRTGSVTGALALGAAGRADEFAAAVRRLGAARSPRRRRAAVLLALAYHRADLARAACGALPAADPERARLEALTAAAEGHLEAALAAVSGRADRRSRAAARALAADLAVTAPEGRPRVAGPLGTSRAGAVDRVLHLVTNSLPEVVAGYTTRTHGLVSAQRRAGLDAQVLTRLGFPVTAGRLVASATVRHDGVPYHRLLPMAVPRLADDALAADVAASLALVRRLRPQVLHAHSRYLNARVALGVRDVVGLPVVYELRGLLEETWLSRGGDPTADVYRLAQESEAEALLAADAVVTISEGLRETALARGVDPSRVVVVPNSVDVRFTAPPPDPSTVRARCGIDEDEVVVGTLSTLNAYEGLDVLLAAVGLLRDAGHPVRALLVGDGPERGALTRLAHGLPEGTAVLTGRVPFGDVHAHHAALDVFCVPRLDLPVTAKVTPLKPLEALATARPVVASDLAPLREIVRPGAWGALAPAGDPSALAAALEPYVADAHLRAEHGRQGRDWVLAERTWDRAAGVYRDLYGAVSSLSGR